MEILGVLMYEIGLILSGFLLGYTTSIWIDYFKRKKRPCKHVWIGFGLLQEDFCIKCKKYFNEAE
jgi:hypothetical protein